MPQTADNVAAEFGIGREDQDAFALRSQQRWAAAERGRLLRQRDRAGRGAAGKAASPGCFDTDEHPRPDTTLEKLARLKGVNGPELSVTAGNASGVNDGACALLLASETAAAAPRPDAARPRRRHGHGRRAAADHGHRPGARPAARCWRGPA